MISTLSRNRHTEYIEKIKEVGGSSLVALLPLNERSGLTAYDHSGNENHCAYTNLTDNTQRIRRSPTGEWHVKTLRAGTSPGVNTYNAVSNGMSGTEGTWLVWYALDDYNITTGAQQMLFTVWGDSNNFYRVYESTSLPGYYFVQWKVGGTTLTRNVYSTRNTAGSWNVIAQRWSATNNEVAFFDGGVQKTTSTMPGVWSAGGWVSTSNVIGTDATATGFNKADGGFAYAAFFSSWLSDATIAELSNVDGGTNYV